MKRKLLLWGFFLFFFFLTLWGFKFWFLWFMSFWNRVSLCSPICTGIQYLDRLTWNPQSFFCLCLQSAGTKDVGHQHPANRSILFNFPLYVSGCFACMCVYVPPGLVPMQAGRRCWIPWDRRNSLFRVVMGAQGTEPGSSGGAECSYPRSCLSSPEIRYLGRKA